MGREAEQKHFAAIEVTTRLEFMSRIRGSVAVTSLTHSRVLCEY